MKNLFKNMVLIFCIATMLALPNVGMTGMNDRESDINLSKNNYVELPQISAPSGNPASNKGWLYVKDSSGTTKLYFEDDAGSVTDLVSAASATAWNDITNPAADKTITWADNYTSIFSFADTNEDMFIIRGVGNFGDVSVLRVESLTGNPTDGTVLEVVSHDANVDPLVVSTSGQAGVFVVSQDGSVDVTGAMDVSGALTAGSLVVSGNWTLGDGTGTVAVSSTSWDVSTAGAFSGVTSLGMSGDLTLSAGDVVLANGNSVKGSVTTAETIAIQAYDNDGGAYVNSILLTNGNTPAIAFGTGAETVAVNSSDWDISTAGAMTGIGAITMDGLLTGSLGATITGAAVNLNASSNFAVNVGTGTTTEAVTIGGGSNTVAVNSSSWDISTLGALTGIADITGTAGAAMTVTLASDGAADDLTISVTGANDSSVLITSAGTGADAVGISTSDGGITISAVGAVAGDIAISAGDDITITPTDTLAINTSDWDITATGVVSGIASITFDSSTGIYHATVELSNADIKGLRASPKALVAATGANTFIEFVSAVLILDYGSEVLTESSDDLVIQYSTSGQDVSASIQTTGFIDQAADQMAFIPAATIATMTAANAVNKGIELFNTGDGEIAGNASNDTTMTVKVAYRVHADGL
jgi:hypothetical protein